MAFRKDRRGGAGDVEGQGVAHRTDGCDQSELVIAFGKDVGDGAEELVATAKRDVNGTAAHAGCHPSRGVDERTAGPHQDKGKTETDIEL